MEAAVLTIWGVGLAGALVATLVILKEVSLVLRTLGHIRELADLTRRAAEALRDDLAAVSGLPRMAEAATDLLPAAEGIRSAARGLRYGGPGGGAERPGSGGPHG